MFPQQKPVFVTHWDLPHWFMENGFKETANLRSGHLNADVPVACLRKTIDHQEAPVMQNGN